MTIRVLPPQLVSQIAAGEVVERPASVVKELVENSLDAGARQVTVELERGGLRLIRVRDDGAGIPREQLPLALARHATSKIATLDELERVASLGFRGEALPSIASVSRLTLRSRAVGAEAAYSVTGVGDDELATPRPCAHPEGTTVEVAELFARIPARRKFLRTESTELRHAQQVLRSLAAARAEVAFRLCHNGRELLKLPAGGAAERVTGLCGRDFMDHALALDETAAGMGLRGWIATPGFSRSRSDLQFSFVNGRTIRDRLFNHAVRQAYEDVLHYQRFPAFVLHLALDPAQVDVNAHPAKAEVRFRNSRLVHDFLFKTLHTALRERGGVHGHHIRLPLRDTPAGAAAPQRGFALGVGLGVSPGVNEGRAAYQFQAPPAARAPADEPQAAAMAPAAAQHSPRLGHALAQLRGVYILAENNDGLVLVDMHAAHERVLYERLKRSFAAGSVAVQPLLVPQDMDVGPQHAELVEQYGPQLTEVGVQLDRSAPGRVTLRALPAVLGEVDGAALVRDLLADLAAEQGTDRVRRAGDRLLADMGCRAAIKAGRRLSLAEMDALLRDMETTDRAGHCNHGRPSWVQVALADLDRLFMRGK